VRRQVGGTSYVVGRTRQRARGAVLVTVDLVVRTAHLAENAAAALRRDRALPRRVLTYAAHAQLRRAENTNKTDFILKLEM